MILSWRNQRVHSIHRVAGKVYSFRSFAVKAMRGRATTAGTMQFLRNSNMDMHHRLEKSRLFITPIVHGPPGYLRSKMEKTSAYIEAITRRAVVINRSNCIVVYQHLQDNEPWYSTNLRTLFEDSRNKISRDQIVIMANLGYATTQEEICKRLAQACEVTGLECIDGVMIDVS